jgi:hypothetical protein
MAVGLMRHGEGRLQDPFTFESEHDDLIAPRESPTAAPRRHRSILSMAARSSAWPTSLSSASRTSKEFRDRADAGPHPAGCRAGARAAGDGRACRDAEDVAVPFRLVSPAFTADGIRRSAAHQAEPTV